VCSDLIIDLAASQYKKVTVRDLPALGGASWWTAELGANVAPAAVCREWKDQDYCTLEEKDTATKKKPRAYDALLDTVLQDAFFAELDLEKASRSQIQNANVQQLLAGLVVQVNKKFGLSLPEPVSPLVQAVRSSGCQIFV
jgi:hypothetical protein